MRVRCEPLFQVLIGRLVTRKILLLHALVWEFQVLIGRLVTVNSPAMRFFSSSFKSL